MRKCRELHDWACQQRLWLVTGDAGVWAQAQPSCCVVMCCVLLCYGLMFCVLMCCAVYRNKLSSWVGERMRDININDGAEEYGQPPPRGYSPATQDQVRPASAVAFKTPF